MFFAFHSRRGLHYHVPIVWTPRIPSGGSAHKVLDVNGPRKSQVYHPDLWVQLCLEAIVPNNTPSS